MTVHFEPRQEAYRSVCAGPFWRWQTQVTFFLGFNAILNWNHLHAGKAEPKKRREVRDFPGENDDLQASFPLGTCPSCHRTGLVVRNILWAWMREPIRERHFIRVRFSSCFHAVFTTVCLLFLGSTAFAQSSQTISTFAGTGVSGYTGDGGPATSARLSTPIGAAMDSAGNFYVASHQGCIVRKISSSGIISTFVGTGTCTSTGDGGAATSATINYPTGLVVDSSDNLYVAEYNGQRIRRITSSGTISTVAGTGTGGYSGDGGSATSAKLSQPVGLSLDSSGNLYIADSANARIRKVSAGIITTVAGNGTTGSSGDGGLATAANLFYPYGVALDSSNNLYIADTAVSRVRKVDGVTGIISNFAGTGTSGFSGDGGPATSAKLGSVTALTLDPQGNLYIAESNRVRQVDTNGIITTVAGTGTGGYSGDGGPATSATLRLSYGILAPASGGIYYSDFSSNVVRLISAGKVTTLPATAVGATSASTLAQVGLISGLGTSASLVNGSEFSVDTSSCVYSSTPSFRASCNVTFSPSYPGLRWDALVIKDAGNTVVGVQHLYGNGQAPLLAISPGVISTINMGGAGSVSSEGAAFDALGNAYLSDGPNNRIIRISAGVVSALTITGATLSNPKGLALDDAGNLYVADSGNNRILRIAADGSAIALGISGLSSPSGLAMDTARTLFISDTGNNRVVKYFLSGTTSNLAVAPTLSSPAGLAFATDGTLYIVNQGGSSIVKVAAGVSSTLTITGAALASPTGVAADPAGNLYVTDSSNNVVYRVRSTGAAMTIAGSGTAGNSGDNGPAPNAQISAPKAVAVARDGSLLFGDSGNGTVRMVSGSATVTFPDATVGSTSTQNAVMSNIGTTGLTFPASFNFTQVSGPFSLSSSGSGNCSASLGLSFGVGNVCTLYGQFAPSVSGVASDTVSLAGGLYITLSGKGLGVATFGLNTNALTFGAQAVGAPSSTQTITLTNSGSGAVDLPGIALSGANAPDFLKTSTCGATLGANSTCTVSVVFTPSAIGARTATLTITASDATSHASLNQVVALTGTATGVNPTPTPSNNAPQALRFVPLAPCRVVDTRFDDDGFSGSYLAGNTTRDFALSTSSHCSIPANAAAYSLNLTTIARRSGSTYLQAWATGQEKPETSVMNFDRSTAKSNAAVVAAGTNGAISFSASGDSELILDINGYFVADNTRAAYHPLASCRAVDTRSGIGGGTMLAAGSTRAIALASHCGLPADATAYVLNFTAMPRRSLVYLQAWGASGQPETSMLNSFSGKVMANAAVVQPASDGNISVYASDDTDLIVDVAGYYSTAAPNGLSFYVTPPCRALDTRISSEMHSVEDYGTVTLTHGGCSGLLSASSAQAYLLNTVVVPNGRRLSYLSLWNDDGSSRPGTSILNATDGAVTSNLAVLPSASGRMKVFATDSTHLIVDVVGYFGN